MELLKSYLFKNPDTAARTIESEAVIVLPEKSKVHVLNPVGTRIWDMANGELQVDQIIDRIQDEFEEEPDQIKNDTLEFINSMISAELFMINSESQGPANG